MKFGDIVVNEWGDNTDPRKVLLFVRKTSKDIYCLSLKGERAMFDNDRELRLTVIGSLNLKRWAELAGRERELKANED